MIVKENTVPRDTAGTEQTHGKTREVSKWEETFRQAGFDIVYNKAETNYPATYSEVRCFVLRPRLNSPTKIID